MFKFLIVIIDNIVIDKILTIPCAMIPSACAVLDVIMDLSLLSIARFIAIFFLVNFILDRVVLL